MRQDKLRGCGFVEEHHYLKPPCRDGGSIIRITVTVSLSLHTCLYMWPRECFHCRSLSCVSATLFVSILRSRIFPSTIEPQKHWRYTIFLRPESETFCLIASRLHCSNRDVWLFQRLALGHAWPGGTPESPHAALGTAKAFETIEALPETLAAAAAAEGCC